MVDRLRNIGKYIEQRRLKMNKNFIGEFENALDSNSCKQIISYFEELDQLELTSNRRVSENEKRHIKDDTTAFLLQPQILTLNKTNPILQNFLNNFWICYNMYVDDFSILNDSEPHSIKSVRLQKTLPGQGYHNWHYESSTTLTSNRVLAWMLYLNDVQEGGETEFLYSGKRISPKEGQLLIWPAGFTHTHRGNPPLEETKYILTGWVEFVSMS